MSPKEKLANEYINLRKELDGSDFNPNSWNLKVTFLKQFKICDLEDKINTVKSAIKEREIRLMTDKYYESEEGIEFKKNTESRLDFLNSLIEFTKKSFEDDIKRELKEMFGEGWCCQYNLSQHYSSIEIGLKVVDEKRKNKGFEFEFGHTFTIYLDSSGFGKDRFYMNYGTLGNFDLFGDGLREKYLMGMASVANNKEWLQSVKERMKENSKTLINIENEYNELSQKLKNPLNL